MYGGIDEACSLVGLDMLAGVLGRLGGLVAPGEASVVKTLSEKDDVGNRVVNGKDDLAERSCQCLGVPGKSVVGGGMTWRTMVGRTPWRTAPRMLKTSPTSQTMMNCTERASALLRWKFWMIWGENTTTSSRVSALEVVPSGSAVEAHPSKRWRRIWTVVLGQLWQFILRMAFAHTRICQI